MRKVRRFNLGVATQELKGSGAEGDAVQPSPAFVTGAVGRVRERQRQRNSGVISFS